VKHAVACWLVAFVMLGGRALAGPTAQEPQGASPTPVGAPDALVAPGPEQRPAGERPAVPPAKPAPRDAGRPHSFEVTASVLWLGPSSLGTSAAHETANDGTSTPYTLFTATGDLTSAAGFEARLGYHVTRAIAVEGGVTYSRPSITFAIASDAEGAPGVTGTGETTTQLFLDASLVGYLSSLRFAGGKGRPFLEAGFGYLRQLHGQTGATSGYFASDTGQVYHVGGGVRYFFRPRGAGLVKGLGLRVDARVYFRHGGYSFDGSGGANSSLGGGAVVAF
jgi:hypothetical protein